MSDRAALAKHWPLFGLAVRTPRLTLRYPTDDDLAVLAELSGDIHDPDFLPFSSGWSLRPDEERRRGLFQWHWSRRAELSAERWAIEFATVVDGEVVGTQGVMSRSFAALRTVETGSWLARSRQGQGIGAEMRAAVLHLAFAGFGAERAETGAIVGNEPSLRVTRGLGYRPNGDALHDVEGQPRRELRFVLDRADWESRRRDDIEIEGLDACRALLALDPPPS